MASVTEERPDNFDSKVIGAGVFVHADGKLLYLQNAEKPFEDYKWAVPGGKLEEGEAIEECAARELFEETTIVGKPTEIGHLYVVKPHFAFKFHLFELFLSDVPSVTLSQEHKDYGWFTPEELETIDLISGGKEVLEWYLNFSKS